jgi:hypothetical protein
MMCSPWIIDRVQALTYCHPLLSIMPAAAKNTLQDRSGVYQLTERRIVVRIGDRPRSVIIKR